MKRFFLAVLVMAVVFSGTFAAWQSGLVRRAWRGAAGLLSSGEAVPEVADAAVAEAAPPARTRGEMLSAMVASKPGVTVTAAPQAEVVLPAAALRNDASPIDVASLSNSEPQSVPAPVSAPAVPAPVVAPVSAQQQLQMQVLAKTQPSAPQPAVAQAPVATQPVAVVPVLSDAKAQLRVIDQMLSSNPSEALARLNDLSAAGLADDDAAEVGYRKGYAARVLRDEAAAEKAWRETSDQFPALRGGRFSAMALGDTWFQRYADARPNMNYWDDISIQYSRALGRDDAPFLPEQVKEELKLKLKIINDQILFGSAPSKLARYHKVEPGELLGSIANKYRIDYESIARVNGINPNRIGVGMDLKLVVGDVDVVVRKYANDPSRTPTVTWFIDGRWAREYPACVGDGVKTPAGTYTFTLKERDPSWTNPLNGQLLPNDHPENILGSRWMAMKGMNTQGLGIHGTTVDDSIPGYTSAGCVRLHNSDVEELFSFGRIGGRVTILE